LTSRGPDRAPSTDQRRRDFGVFAAVARSADRDLVNPDQGLVTHDQELRCRPIDVSKYFRVVSRSGAAGTEIAMGDCLAHEQKREDDARSTRYP
jgi:hypothetical protein